MTVDRTYLDELERALTRRGLATDRAGEVIAEVAGHLGDSGERAHEAFGEPDDYAAALVAADAPGAGSEPRYEQRTFRATAADELAILAALGADGWELTGVRDFGLHARRPRDDAARTTWEHARRSAVRRGPVLAEMQAAGWTPCGRWLTFHYFKRAAA